MHRVLRNSAGTIGAAVLVVLLIGLIQVFALTTSTKYQRVLVDLGHVPVFAAIAVAILLLVRAASAQRSVNSRSYLVAGVTVVLLGIASEALQLLEPDRSASATDVIRNCAGGALGLISCRFFTRPIATHAKLWLAGVASILIICLLAPAMLAAAAYAQRIGNWPTVLGENYVLERVFAVSYKSTINVERTPVEWRMHEDESSLTLRLDDCPECGVLLQELVQDWQGLTEVCLEITNAERDPLDLAVRLGDAAMFFRSMSFVERVMVIPARSRVERCVVIAPPTQEAPAVDNVVHGSLALLSTSAGEARQFHLHRIWFQ